MARASRLPLPEPAASERAERAVAAERETAEGAAAERGMAAERAAAGRAGRAIAVERAAVERVDGCLQTSPSSHLLVSQQRMTAALEKWRPLRPVAQRQLASRALEMAALREEILI